MISVNVIGERYVGAFLDLEVGQQGGEWAFDGVHGLVLLGVLGDLVVAVDFELVLGFAVGAAGGCAVAHWGVSWLVSS